MKKMLAMLIAVVMVMSMTACVTEEDPGDTRAKISIPQEVLDTPTRVNADFYPMETDTVLRVLFTEGGEGETDASKLWEKATGVELDVLSWTGEQMFASLAANDVPDAIVMPWEFDKAKVYEFGKAGKFLDFSKHLHKMPNLCALIREYPEILEVCGYPDGAMYSLPKVGWSNTYQSNLFYIRTDLLEEMGWDHSPATTDEFLQFVKDAQAKYSSNPSFIAFVPNSKTYMAWEGMNTIAATLFPAFGELIETGLTVNSQNEVVLGAASGQYRYYLEYMNELWNSGAFATEIFTMDSTASRAIIRNGNCAVSIGTYPDKGAFSDGVVDVTVMEPLTSRYQDTKQWRKTADITFRACVANANCEYLDTLLAFLDSFYAPEENPLNKEGTVYGASLAKGELGVHWSMDHDAKTWTSGQDFTNYSDNLFSGVYGTYTPTESLTIKGSGTNANLLPYAKETYNLSNLVLSQNDQDDFTDIWSDLEKYISQMHDKFITGNVDIEAGWDDYLNQLERMGLQDILDMYQRSYNDQ